MLPRNIAVLVGMWTSKHYDNIRRFNNKFEFMTLLERLKIYIRAVNSSISLPCRI